VSFAQVVLTIPRKPTDSPHRVGSDMTGFTRLSKCACQRTKKVRPAILPSATWLPCQMTDGLRRRPLRAVQAGPPLGSATSRKLSRVGSELPTGGGAEQPPVPFLMRGYTEALVVWPMTDGLITPGGLFRMAFTNALRFTFARPPRGKPRQAHPRPRVHICSIRF
jgi:hypothetical protein